MYRFLVVVKCFSKLHKYRYIFVRYQPSGLGSGTPKGWPTIMLKSFKEARWNYMTSFFRV